MTPWCRHRVPWGFGCAACEAEHDACDPTPIERMFEIYANVDALYVVQGRPAPRDSDTERLVAAIGVYNSHATRWYARHPNHAADLGGEG